MPPRLPTSEDFPKSVALDIVPPSKGSPVNILLLFHGLGDTNTSFTILGKNLNLPETACISIRGFNPIPPIFTGSDSPSFHWASDVIVDESRGEIDLDPGGGFVPTTQTLRRDIVDVLISKCGYAARNILFLGYGQGGMLPLALTSSQDLEFGGVISIGGRLPSSTSSSSGENAKSKTPVLVCGGSRSSQVTRSAIDALKSRFGDVQYVKWDKPDDSMPVNREEMLPIMKFLARRLLSRAGVPEGAVEV